MKETATSALVVAAALLGTAAGLGPDTFVYAKGYKTMDARPLRGGQLSLRPLQSRYPS